MNFANLGWRDTFAQAFIPYYAEGFLPARVTLEHKNLYIVATEAHGEIPASVTGRMLFDAETREQLPVVGDWVVIRLFGNDDPQATIDAVLPRSSKFSRRAAGRQGGEQPVAANIDIAFLLTGLDGNYNPRRIERYLQQTRLSNVQPVVLLTKADLRPDLDACLHEVADIAGDTPVHAISPLTGEGLEGLSRYLQPGITIALLGSSGVGKSTLLNQLLGSTIMRTQAVRDDDNRGRHTTSHRQLFQLASGAALIDTPGMRELQLWGEDDGLVGTFPEIDQLAEGCRFPDCRHQEEPGCAVKAALANGDLHADRFANYLKMQRELQHLAAKTDFQEAQAIKQKWKTIHLAARAIKKERGR